MKKLIIIFLVLPFGLTAQNGYSKKNVKIDTVYNIPDSLPSISKIELLKSVNEFISILGKVAQDDYEKLTPKATMIEFWNWYNKKKP